jgi:hypothetical protein
VKEILKVTYKESDDILPPLDYTLIQDESNSPVLNILSAQL